MAEDELGVVWDCFVATFETTLCKWITELATIEISNSLALNEAKNFISFKILRRVNISQGLNVL